MSFTILSEMSIAWLKKYKYKGLYFRVTHINLTRVRYNISVWYNTKLQHNKGIRVSYLVTNFLLRETKHFWWYDFLKSLSRYIEPVNSHPYLLFILKSNNELRFFFEFCLSVRFTHGYLYLLPSGELVCFRTTASCGLSDE